MKLDYIIVNTDYQHYTKVKHLFEHAFSIEERPSFKTLLSFKNNTLYALELDSTFVALVDIVECGDLLYIFFLATKKTFRRKGIASQIIKDITDKYKDKSIFLLAEDPDIKCDNLKERIERIHFYEHNGFKVSKNKVIEYNVQYVILYKSKIVSKEDFISVMKHVLEIEFFMNSYLKNVK